MRAFLTKRINGTGSIASTHSVRKSSLVMGHLSLIKDRPIHHKTATAINPTKAMRELAFKMPTHYFDTFLDAFCIRVIHLLSPRTSIPAKSAGVRFSKGMCGLT